MLGTLFQVALGGALGSCMRYLTTVGAMRAFGPGFPWGTMAVNVAGSFAIGVLAVILGHIGATRLAPFLVTGILGGFTTFSAFTLDTVTLLDRGAPDLAAAYLAGSLGLSFAAILLGMALSRAAFA